MNGAGLLLEARPSWWNFFWHIVLCWLIFPILIALWKKASLVLRVTEGKVILVKGVLSKHSREIFISDIRAIDVKQSFFQRIFGIGDIMIATAGTAGYEDVASGLKNPKDIKDLIIGQRRQRGSTKET